MASIDETIVLGAQVDSVQEVVKFENNSIEPAPNIGNKLDTEFIHGMGRRNGELIIIPDIEKVFSSDTLATVKKAGSFGNDKEMENN